MINRSAGARPRGLTAVALAVGALALLPGLAQAASVGTGQIAFPTQVTVGQTGIPGSITLSNENSGADQGNANEVCNASDPSPPCAPSEPGIQLVPTCKQVASGACTGAGYDPGVFQLSSQGVGRQATACAGVLFAITPVDPTSGTLRFDPLPAGTHVTLPAAGSSCVIDFTFGVLKMPTGDQNPFAAGVQTAQTLRAVQSTPASSLNSLIQITSNIAPTVVRATPAIATTASPGIRLGGQLSDQATVSGLVSPQPGSTITFNLFPPAAGEGCAGAPAFSSTKPATVDGGSATATSDPFTPTEVGTYRWTATFNGDVNNAPVTGVCNDPTETRTVTPPPTTTTGSCVPAADGTCVIRGTAAITGKSGCVTKSFAASVRGTLIKQVVFTVDGKRKKTVKKANSKKRWELTVIPRSMKVGVHKIVAHVTFTTAAKTKTRLLRVTFSRCPGTTRPPVFTGR
jgi:hypothetical protein